MQKQDLSEEQIQALQVKHRQYLLWFSGAFFALMLLLVAAGNAIYG
ncbi:MAG: hypothetical protein ING75_04775 [Rhodocyclaceae bacterium]|nr:hypothetical protein [Rhodocyclaceae bacterium]